MNSVVRLLSRMACVITALGHGTQVSAQIATVDPAKIDEIFAYTANTKSPGCVVAAIRNGKIEFARGYGMADIKHGTPITPQTAFNVGSVTKQFTAAAINLLVVDGRLSLDDDIRKYVPELPRYEVPITIRHLVNHTSGLRNYDAMFQLAGESHGITSSEMLEMLARQRRLNFRTGEQWAYSNSGYTLLGVIVERVSGKSLPAFAEERLFRPLGMTSTAFRVRSDIPKGWALAYLRENGKFRQFTQPVGVVGAGGLYSTVEDLALWQRHMEEPRLGGARWRELTEARDTLTDGMKLRYGAGLMDGSFAGQATVEHGGGNPGFTASLMRFPRVHLSIAVLCNRGSPGDRPSAQELSQRVAALYVGPDTVTVAETAIPSTVRLTAQEMASYTGTFFNERTPVLSIREIVVDSGKLFYVRGPTLRGEMVPLGDSRFQVMGTGLSARFVGRDTLKFDRAQSGPTFGAPSPGSGGGIFVRVGTTRRDLRDYAGTYVSSEIPTRWKVQVVDTALVVNRQRSGPYRLVRAFEDAFVTPGSPQLARFIRDDKGNVIAMEFSASDRAWHVRFERQR